MLMSRRPDEVRMLLIDPKMVELSPYKTLPHLMHPVVTDMRKAEAILAWAVDKMEERYALLARAGVRHISGYNQLGEEELMERLQPESDEERQQIPTNLPYIVIVADEMADLMMTAAKEVETHIIVWRKRAVPSVSIWCWPRKSHGRRDHGSDQVELAGENRLPSGQPHGQPRGARRDGGRQVARQRRYALPVARQQHAHPRPRDLRQRRRDQKGGRLCRHERAGIRQGVGAAQAGQSGR